MPEVGLLIYGVYLFKTHVYVCIFERQSNSKIKGQRCGSTDVGWVLAYLAYTKGHRSWLAGTSAEA